MNSEKLCEYGCGQIATHQFKNGKWCCAKTIGGCPKIQKHRYEQRTEKHKIAISKGVKKAFINNPTLAEKYSHKRTINYIKHKYPTFSKIEEMRYNPHKPNEKEIQVHCKNHNCLNSKEQSGWFTPNGRQIESRISAIEHPNGNEGYYFYCSNECKQTCSLYNKKITEFIKEDQIRAGIIKEEYYTSTEYNIWREEVLKRANYKCEYCEEKAEHAHHSRPQKLEPFFSLDPDFGFACCEKCHYKYGHNDECSTGQLSNVICNS